MEEEYMAGFKKNINLLSFIIEEEQSLTGFLIYICPSLN